MNTIKVQVRIEWAGTGNERLVAFWREGRRLGCFTWQEGHGEACDQYRLSLPAARATDAAEFVANMQRHYDSTAERDGYIKLELVQRLPRQG